MQKRFKDAQINVRVSPEFKQLWDAWCREKRLKGKGCRHVPITLRFMLARLMFDEEFEPRAGERRWFEKLQQAGLKRSDLM